MLNILMNKSIGADLIIMICAQLDRAVYSLISYLYNLIMILAKINIFSGSFESFAIKMYSLIGLFMMFRISFSLINYIINPDELSDKQKGGTTLLKNIVITFALIILTPSAFSLLYEAQDAILDDQILARFVLSEDSDSTNMTEYFSIDDDFCKSMGVDSISVSNMGNYIALAAFKPFYQAEEGSESLSWKYAGNATTTPDDVQYNYCVLNSASAEDRSVSTLLDSSIYIAPIGDTLHVSTYRVNYLFIISTIVGGAIAFLLASFCLDVAARSIKLSFLQIISPIPIMSYIDPNQAKSGMFKKWLSEVGKTWLDLFIRILGIYLLIYVITAVSNSSFDFGDITAAQKMWASLLLIIGGLIFAKKLPDLIGNLFGIKLDGGFTLNPLKKISDQALGGKALAGALFGAASIPGAALGSSAANVLANRGKKNITWKDNFKTAGKGLATGSFFGAITGYKAGSAGKYNPLSNFINSVERNSKNRNLGQDLIEQKVVGGGPLPVARYGIENKYTDVIGKRGSGGSTDELKTKLNELKIEKELASSNKNSALRAIANLNTSENEQFIPMFDKAFDRTILKKPDGKLDIDDAGKVKWETPINRVDDWLRENPISFKDDYEYEKFKSAYNSRSEAERQFRDAYNEELRINKVETKLTKQKETFEKYGKSDKK